MKAVATLGHGGYSQLSCQDYPVPEIRPDEVLLKVLAAGAKNTEINTRLGRGYILAINSSYGLLP